MTYGSERFSTADYAIMSALMEKKGGSTTAFVLLCLPYLKIIFYISGSRKSGRDHLQLSENACGRVRAVSGFAGLLEREL